MKMNYNTENRTPRDRLSDELFFKEYGTEYHRPDSRQYNCRKCAEARNENSRKDAGMPCNGPCGGKSSIDTLPLAMVYAPVQEWRELFDTENALKHGTLFKELVFPFYPTPCNKGRECK